MVGALNVNPRIGTVYHRYLKKWIRVLVTYIFVVIVVVLCVYALLNL